MAEATGVTVAGRALHCPHCGHDRFYSQRTKVENVYLGGLITGGSYGDLYLCARCGYTQVFFPVREDPAQLASRASLDNATAIRELLEANRELGEEDENPSR